MQINFKPNVKLNNIYDYFGISKMRYKDILGDILEEKETNRDEWTKSIMQFISRKFTDEEFCCALYICGTIIATEAIMR